MSENSAEIVRFIHVFCDLIRTLELDARLPIARGLEKGPKLVVSHESV